MYVNQRTLEKLDFLKIQQALSERAQTSAGKEKALSLKPSLSKSEIELAWQRLAEALDGTALSLGGVEDIRGFIDDIRDGNILEGKDILSIAYTLDSAGTIKRSILNSERPTLGEMAKEMRSFDAVLRMVREQLDMDGKVRDDATPKLREIRKRLNPLRGRIRDKMQQLLERYKDSVQDPIVTLRRDRYVIPIKANEQSKVPGLVLDTSDSGATVFLEPQDAVPMNNELALLEFEDRDEVRRILTALGQRLAYEEGLEETLAILAEIDLVAASARLSQEWQLARPSFDDDKQLIALPKARHPLIEDCIANDITFDDEHRLLVITGPNAGGKTVLLKTLGLAVMMAQSGLFVACEKGKPILLPFLEAVLSDIGDEQSIEASLSTYAGHLTNLKQIIQEASPKVLILIDELGSGTDPAEGAALSQAVVEKVLDSGAKGLITTHLAPLKVFASETKGIQNAAMQYDVDELRPKYELVLGQPGRSYALSIAERIGLPTKILHRADELLGEESAELETLLETLERQREELKATLAEVETARDEAVSEAKLLRKQITTLRRQEEEVMAKAAEKADVMLQNTLQQAKELKRTAQEGNEDRGKALNELAELRRTVKTKAKAPKKRKKKVEPSELDIGVTVYASDYDASGPIIDMRDDDVIVQLGLLKVTLAKDEVELIKQPEKAKEVKVKESNKKKARKKFNIASESSSAPPRKFLEELNLRGERAEPAIDKVRDFVLEAKALKVPSVRILHGKGTGALRDAVRDYLKREKMVERYEDAVPYEGGHGVTVAYIRF